MHFIGGTTFTKLKKKYCMYVFKSIFCNLQGGVIFAIWFVWMLLKERKDNIIHFFKEKKNKYIAI